MKREDIEKAAAIYTAQAEDSDYAEILEANRDVLERIKEKGD